MTDTPDAVDVDVEAQGWDDSAHGESYPEYPANPHNHRYTVSIDSRGPMLVVRGNTVDEVQSAFEELENAGAGAAIGRAWAAVKAGAALGNGLGATPVQGPPAPPQAATPPPFGPNVSVPQAPGYQGPPVPPPAPAAPQGGYGGQQQGRSGPKPRPMDWPQVYKIEVPYNAKDSFKAFREQYKDAFRGKIQWAGGGGYWIHGDIVQSFANYNPMPA